jgi:DNA-directed RNA polymerase specialized sigma24 family protein
VTDDFAAIRAGDEAAYEVVFRENYAGLCRYADWYLRSTDGAEDVVQDVLARMWIYRDRLPVVPSAPSWLYGATRHHLMQVIRCGKLAIRDKARDRAIVFGAWSAPEPQPDEVVIARETAHRACVAIAAMPQAWQRVYYAWLGGDGWAQAALAESIGLKPKQFRNIMFRVRGHMRAALGVTWELRKPDAWLSW